MPRVRPGQARPVGAHGFKQVERAHNVGLDEIAGTVDRAIDMRLGCEIQHGTRLMGGKQLVDQFAIANIAVHEDMPRIALKRCKVFQIAGIGELVEVDDRLVAICQPGVDKIVAG